MIVVERSRMDAVKALSKFVATERGRSMLRNNDFQPGTPIVPVFEGESIPAVMARVRATGATRVALAVHFPTRARELEFVELRPANSQGTDHIETRGSSTIGMLVDTLVRGPRGGTFSVSSSVVAHHFDLQPA